jgi:hypothetical protein
MRTFTFRAVASGVFLLCLSQTLMAADSLCLLWEKNYFSCTFKNGKLVSLCGNAYVREQNANDWIEQENPWLQYRYGFPDKVELIYPPQHKDSLDKFQGEYGAAQQGTVTWKSVSFVNAGVGYKIEYLVPHETAPFEGVRIGKPTKMDIKIPTHRKAKYPKADVPCVGESHHERIRFDELVRFLVHRNGS